MSLHESYLDASPEAWARLGEALLNDQLTPEEQAQILHTVKSWPDSLRRVEVVGGKPDPWWDCGRAPGTVELLQLVRVLVIDPSNWKSLPPNSRWRTGGADQVRELDVRLTEAPDEVCELIAELPSLSRLKLDGARLVWRPFGLHELAPILHALRTPLTHLGLGGVDLFTWGAKLLLEAPLLAELSWLDLALTDLGDRGARVLAAWPCASLQVLSVRGCKLTTGPIAWRGAPLLRNVVDLDLSLNSITTRAFAAIVESTPRLARLVLTDSQIKPELLGRATHAHLRELDISGSVVGDWLFQQLLEGLGPTLELLTAQSCDITDDSLPALSAALPRLRLKVLDLRDNRFSEAGQHALQGLANHSLTIAC